MVRLVRIFLLFFVIAGVVEHSPPTSHAASTQPIDTITQVLVAQGATPRSIDRQSRILDPNTPPQQFTALVVRWQVNGELASIQLAVRIQTASGWGEWQALSPNDEFADPDALANHATSTMISTDIPATAWQAQLMLSPNSTSYVTQISGITMNTQLPNASRRVLTSAAFSTPNGSKPAIVSRTTWGDSSVALWDQRAANGETTNATWLPEPAEIANPSMITIHHTATPNDALGSDWAARVRSIWRYHTITHGWGDIGYHFLIDPNGVIYSGRLNGVRDNGTIIDGAHAYGYNRANIGISMMGTFNDVAPTTAAQNALNSLIAWITTTYHITPNTTAYYAYKNVILNTIVGHRDISIGGTTCPGGVLHNLIPGIRVTAAINNGTPPSDHWIDSVSAKATTIFQNDTAEFTIKIRNNYDDGTTISGAAFSFAESDASYTFNQNECWAKRNSSGTSLFDKPAITTNANQRFRVIAGYSSWDGTYANVATKCPVESTVNQPWRWSIGSSPITQGDTRSITGRVRFTKIGSYTVYFGVVKDWIGYPDSPCIPGNSSGACAINPITINVIAHPTATATTTATPTATLSDAVKGRIAAATTTMASYHAKSTVLAFAASQTIIAEHLTTTAIRTNGLQTRTSTRTASKTATATPITLMKSVIALSGATNTAIAALTGTALTNQHAIATFQSALHSAFTQTAYTKKTVTALQKQVFLSATPYAKQTQTAMIATQRSNNATRTAEIINNVATRSSTSTSTSTPSPTRTYTKTATSTRSATSTKTNTVTMTISPTQVSVIIPTSIATLTLSSNITQLINNQHYYFALTGNESTHPQLETIDLTDFTLQTPFAIDGYSANLMCVNQTDDNQLVVIGRLSWNTLFVQRLDVSVNPPVETGYWTMVSAATPSALVVSGRYIYVALTQSIPNSPIFQTTLITLANDAWLHEISQQIALPGPVSVMQNSDSGEFGIIIAGTKANNKGYLLAGNIQNARLTTGAPLTVPLRINQIVSKQQITGITPQNMLFTSDGISLTQYQLDIATKTLTQLSIQSIPNVQIALAPNPTQLLAVTNSAPWQVLLYNVLSRGVMARGTAVISPDQPTNILAVGQWLTWNNTHTLYRALLDR